MSDQAEQLRKLVRETVQQHPALAPGVPLVVLSGGKGGVGVSTVAMELVSELAALGKRSVLVDANPMQPDITSRLDINASGYLADVLDGSRSVVEVIEPIGDSIKLLPGRWASEAPPELGKAAVNRLIGELRSLHSQADIVVIDAGHGMSPWVQQLWKSAQQILLISTTESIAVMDSYAAVKLSPWDDIDGKVRLVINQCKDPEVASTISSRFEATCQRFLGIRVASAAVLDARPDIVAVVTQRAEPSSDPKFQQSIRLLAADVISASLVYSGGCPGGTASRISSVESSENALRSLRHPNSQTKKSLQKS